MVLFFFVPLCTVLSLFSVVILRELNGKLELFYFFFSKMKKKEGATENK